ncbi:MAG TPA: MAPEG family protein [Pseudomonadales bacterium]
MELVVLVVMLALLQYIFFAAQVGRARVKYGVKAPAVAGHAVFERHLRVQMNTLELLVIFIPAAFSYAVLAERLGWYGGEVAAALGVVFLIGRGVYAKVYIQDPARRQLGFLLSFAPCLALIAGALLAVVATVI